jgi:transcription initiation factor IIE alpha subunit
MVNDNRIDEVSSEYQRYDGMGPLERCFHSAAARIVDFLIIHKSSDFSESEIAQMTELSAKTVNRIMPQLISNNIAQIKRTVSGRTKMYWLHPRSKAAEHLEAFVYETASVLAEEKIHHEEIRSLNGDQHRLKFQNS